MKSLYVIDVDIGTYERYKKRLGNYYEVKDCYAGYPDALDKFVHEYVGDAESTSSKADSEKGVG